MQMMPAFMEGGPWRGWLNCNKNEMREEPDMKHSRWTMRKGLLVFCIGSVLMALLLQTFLFQQSLRRQIRIESIADNETSLKKMQTDISSFIHNLRAEMLTIYNERDLIASLREAAEGEGNLKTYYWSAWYFGRKKFSSDDRLLALYLYDTEDNLVSAYRYNSATLPRNIYNAEYNTNARRVEEYIRSDQTDLMISGYYNPEENKDIVRFVLKLHNYDEERLQIGYLICDIDSTALTSIMDKYVDLAQVCLWLQPGEDHAVAVTGEVSEAQLQVQKELESSIARGGASQEMKEEYGDYYLIHVGQDGYDLDAFALVAQSLLTAAQRSLVRSLLVIMVAMIALLSVFVIWLSRWLSKPVEEMRDSIVRIKNGETDLRVQPVGWFEELEILGREFNDMLDRIQAMALEEYKNKLLMERTEFKMLQAQINPHFLYNTLDTMSGIANAQNCTLVSGLCHSLSAIFRYSLNMTDELSTVQKEMAHVRNYLYVMDVRNGSSIAYEYQIDSETLEDSLPRICLQPIVENAITHGLRRVRRKDKRLLIRAEHSDDRLVITVKDNGIGMDAEKMNQELEKNDPKRVESGVSIGILNVNARLKRLFGDSYGLRIESQMGEGTTVWLTVPIITGETEEVEA